MRRFNPWCLCLRIVVLLPMLPWAGLAQRPVAAELPLHAERAASTDLALVGLLAGVPPGETRFVRWADLGRLPQARLRVAGELVRGEQELTVVFLSDLWAALPVGDDADCLLARCSDGYAAVFETGFIRDYRPFLILQVDGLGPANWPPPGMKFNPGPYVISVSSAVVPAVAGLRDAGHKRPWTVTTLEVARLERSFAPFFAGPWAGASAVARAGRELWIHSCASCHAGPPGTFGGTKGERPFALLAAQARSVPDFFQRYITDPKALVPTARMEPHPAYTKAELEALTAFVASGSER
jgi:cytochrome c2